MTVQLPAALRQQIVAHLEQSYPNEGGGFLLGTVTNGVTVLIDLVPIANSFAAAEQYHRYAMTPQDWARLEDTADARGLTLVGYFHSHPDSPAVPSVFDRDHALPNFTYLITAVYDRQAREMRVWRLHEDRAGFSELPLTLA